MRADTDRAASTTGSRRLARPRVDALLDRGRDLPLTLVVACAGSGKRTAVRSWLAAQGATPIWCPAAAGDADPATFAERVASELERWRPYPGRQLRAALDDAATLGPGSLAAAMRPAFAKLGQPLWLVADVRAGPLDPGIGAMLAALLADPPSRMRLLLLACEQPTLSLSRLRVNHQLNEVRGRDLRFTFEETALLLTEAGTDRPLETATAAVLDATDGWAAGVAAFAVALKQADASADDTSWLRRGAETAASFAREEVLASLPPEHLDLLRRTSPLAKVDAASAEIALAGRPGSGSAAALLNTLVDADLCTADAATGLYRVHRFLRPVLRDDLAREASPAEAKALAARLADHLERQGRASEAIALLVEAGDAAAAVGVLERTIDGALAHDDWPEIERWLGLLPEPVVAASASATIARAWVAHLSGRWAVLPGLADRVAELDAGLPADDPGRRHRHALSELFRCSWLVPGEAEPEPWVARLDAARRLLPQRDRYGRGLTANSHGIALQCAGRHREAVEVLEAWIAREADVADAAYARGVQALCFVHWQAGNLEACRLAADDLLAVATEHRLPVSVGWAHRFLGRVAYEQGAFAAAIVQHRAVLDTRHANRGALVDSAIGLAASELAVGEAKTGLKVLAGAVHDSVVARAPRLTAVLRVAEALLAHRAGQIDIGAALQASGSATIDDISLHALVHPLAARIELLLREGSAASVDEADRLLAVYAARAATAHHLPALVQAECLAAILAERRGDRAAALATLGRAAALGVPHGLRRTYADLAPLLRPVFADLPAHRVADRDLGRVAVLVATGPAARRIPAGNAPREASPLDLLTMREAEVLSLLARRMSYKEIGEVLSISPQTVKHHLANVYGKLGADGRRAALLRAADLGWRLGTDSG